MDMTQSPARRAVLGDERILVVEDELLEAGATVVGPACSVDEAKELIEGVARDGRLTAAVLDIDLEGRAVTPAADTLASLGVPFLFATGGGPNCDMGGHAAAPVLHRSFAMDELIAAPGGLTPTSG